MKKHLILAISLALTPALFAEGPADDVKAAAKKLAEAGSYSWTTSSPGQGDRGGMTTEGKTDKSGAASISTKFGDQPARESVIKGGKVAVKTEDGWKSGEELAARGPGGDGNNGGGGGARRFGGGMAARMAETFKAPAAEAEALATGAKELKKDGDAISGDLTEEAAKARLTFGGGRRGGGGGGGGNGGPPAPTNAKGNVKFWVKDGTLTKYEVTVSGTFEFNGNSRDINRTSTTEIKDAGKTTLEIPAEATAKLSAEAPKKADSEKKEGEKKSEEKKKDEI
jgi:hypothetical protein